MPHDTKNRVDLLNTIMVEMFAVLEMKEKAHGELNNQERCFLLYTMTLNALENVAPSESDKNDDIIYRVKFAERVCSEILFGRE